MSLSLAAGRNPRITREYLDFEVYQFRRPRQLAHAKPFDAFDLRHGFASIPVRNFDRRSNVANHLHMQNALAPARALATPSQTARHHSSLADA